MVKRKRSKNGGERLRVVDNLDHAIQGEHLPKAIVKRNRNGDEIPQVVEKMGDAIEGEHWSKGKGKDDPYLCLVSVNNRKCPYGPFKHKYHFNEHMKKAHKLELEKLKPGPKEDENDKTKKKKKKTTKNPNLKIMTTSYLREKKEFEKKKEAWSIRAQMSWKKLEERARKEPPPGQCPLLLSLIKNGGKLEEFLGVESLGKGNLNFSKIEKLHNLEALADLVRSNPQNNKKVTKDFQELFYYSKWERNEKERKGLVASIVKWHRAKSMKNILITGEDKWIARYLFLKTKFYEMENVSRMERVEVACDSYRAKHGLGDDIFNSGEEGSGEDEVEEDTYEEIVSQTDDDDDGDNHDDEEEHEEDGGANGEEDEEREDNARDGGVGGNGGIQGEGSEVREDQGNGEDVYDF
ncbi:hypothetical protein M758_6G126200 [Ceratodon purpureus]|nr:hypothetical protein M758_6G126200 [Ceratodon purpureus]